MIFGSSRFFKVNSVNRKSDFNCLCFYRSYTRVVSVHHSSHCHLLELFFFFRHLLCVHCVLLYMCLITWMIFQSETCVACWLSKKKWENNSSHANRGRYQSIGKLYFVIFQYDMLINSRNINKNTIMKYI